MHTDRSTPERSCASLIFNKSCHNTKTAQVSVLKQALTDGEKVDIMDESGMTALMWAARAGRLSTAKYLVSQGAILQRRHDDTGFSALHFAAYYCRCKGFNYNREN